MVSKTLLKSYDFANIEDYYRYILESSINGQFSQVKELIKKLSNGQKKVCFNYMTSQQPLNLIYTPDYLSFILRELAI